MNRIILLLILVVTFSCKDEKKKEIKEVETEVVEKQFKTLKVFNSQDLAFWPKTRVNLEPATDVQYIDEVYHLSRNSVTESAFLISSTIPVTYASECRVSIVIKKGIKSKLFGLRITGSYPDRVDAVFDLDSGKVLDYKVSQDFESPMASIESLGDGWFKCILSAEVSADDVRVIMGPTSSDKKVDVWEGKTEIMGDVYFVPSSISFEEEVF